MLTSTANIPTDTDVVAVPRRPLLVAKGLTKRFGQVEALVDADIDLYPGEVVPSSGTTARASRP